MSQDNARSSCPSCGSTDKLRWSVLNKSWTCDNCGHSFGTSDGFIPPKHALYEYSSISYRQPRFPFSKVISVIVILVVIGAAIGVPLRWSPTPTPTSEWIGPHGEKEVERINYTTGPMELRNNPEAVNPTWLQLIQFLQEDTTDLNYYVTDSFECLDFAGMLHNNAEEAGIITAYITIGLTDSEGHACNGFETIDRGFLYIDVTGSQKQDNYPRSCSNDKEVNVVIGQSYVPESIFPCPEWSSTWGSIGTVTDIHIKW